MIRIVNIVPGMRVWVHIAPTAQRLARVLGLVGGPDAQTAVLVEFHPDHGQGSAKLRPDQILAYQGPTVLWPGEVQRLRRKYAESNKEGR